MNRVAYILHLKLKRYSNLSNAHIMQIYDIYTEFNRCSRKDISLFLSFFSPLHIFNLQNPFVNIRGANVSIRIHNFPLSTLNFVSIPIA